MRNQLGLRCAVGLLASLAACGAAPQPTEDGAPIEVTSPGSRRIFPAPFSFLTADGDVLVRSYETLGDPASGLAYLWAIPVGAGEPVQIGPDAVQARGRTDSAEILAISQLGMRIWSRAHGVVQAPGAFPQLIQGWASNGEQVLYLINQADDVGLSNLYWVDLATGESRLVVSGLENSGTLAFDGESFWLSSGENVLSRIAPEDGALTEVAKPAALVAAGGGTVVYSTFETEERGYLIRHGGDPIALGAPVLQAWLSSDGRRVIYQAHDGALRRWEEGAAELVLQPQVGSVVCLDARRSRVVYADRPIVYATQEGAVQPPARLFEIATDGTTPPRTLVGDPHGTGCAYSDDGRWTLLQLDHSALRAVGSDGTTRVLGDDVLGRPRLRNQVVVFIDQFHGDQRLRMFDLDGNRVATLATHATGPGIAEELDQSQRTPALTRDGTRVVYSADDAIWSAEVW